MSLFNQIEEAKAYIQKQTSFAPEIGMILGSGLGDLADQIENPTKIPYQDIPHFPVSTVKGHVGQLVIGELGGQKVLAMQGRIHYYEGYSMQEITFPVRVMKALGIDNMIVTNAAGGINTSLYVGALMLIVDHINFMHDNPLIGANDDRLGPRFPDMLHSYDPGLRKLAMDAARKLDFPLHKGVYSAVSGPTYETQAEMRMLKIIGVDAVGMSTIPEVIVAQHCGIKSLGISAITDMAADESGVSHEEVVEEAAKIKPHFIKLIRTILGMM